MFLGAAVYGCTFLLCLALLGLASGSLAVLFSCVGLSREEDKCGSRRGCEGAVFTAQVWLSVERVPCGRDETDIYYTCVSTRP